MQYVQANIGTMKANAAPQKQAAPAAPAPTEQQVADTSMGARFMRGVMDPLDAAAQMLEQAIPAPVNRVLTKANNALADYGMFAHVPEQGGVTQLVKDREAQYQQSRAAVGQDGIDLARITGNVVSPVNYVPAAGAAKLAQGASKALPAMVKGGVASGAVYGGLTPVTEDGSFAANKAKQVALGATVGGAIPVAGRGLSRVIRPNTAPEVKALMSEGVTPTPGQILGGAWKSAEEKLSSVPLLGAAIRSGQARATDDLNRAALNRTLAPLGEKLPKDVPVGREGISFVEGRLSTAYNTVLDKIGAVKFDPKLSSELKSLAGMFGNAAKPREQAKHLERILDNEIKGRLNPQGFMTSEAMKKAQSRLTEIASSYKASANPDERELGAALSEAGRSMRSWVARQAPQHAAELKKIDAGWANFKRVQRAASGVGAEGGEFSAAQLQNAVKALDRSKDKGAFARGAAPMQDLSEAAKKVLANRVPNSGTADRSMAAGMLAAPLAGGAMINPALAYAALPAAMYTRPGQNALAKLLTQRPQSADAVAKKLEKLLPLVTPMLLPGER
jgi:hypothetical protein